MIDAALKAPTTRCRRTVCVGLALAVAALEIGILSGCGALFDDVDDVERPSLNSRVESLASGQSKPRGVTVVDGTTFWTTLDDEKVWSYNASNGLSEVSGQQEGATDIDNDGNQVFWINRDAGEVMRATLSGNANLVVDGQVSPSRLAVGSENLYWTNGNGTIVRAPKDGSGQSTQLATGQAQPSGIAVNSTHVYWGTRGDSSIWRQALGESGAEPIATELAGAPIDLSLDEESLFIVISTPDPTAGQILRLPLDGGEPFILAENQNNPKNLAVDAVHVYWTNSGSDSIARVEKDAESTGITSTVAVQEPRPWGIAVDETYVYWTNASGTSGAVRRAEK